MNDHGAPVRMGIMKYPVDTCMHCICNAKAEFKVAIRIILVWQSIERELEHIILLFNRYSYCGKGEDLCAYFHLVPECHLTP